MAQKPAQLIGHTFGNLTVVERVDVTESGALWRCVCACGSGESVVKLTSQLRRIKNIGCKQCEPQRRAMVHEQHGGATGGKSALYMIWKGMHSRCRDKGNTSFHRYGARGISVCAEWRDFDAFRRWAESNGWQDLDVPTKDRMSIDRVDSDGPYAPNNCRWLTRSENSRLVHA